MIGKAGMTPQNRSPIRRRSLRQEFLAAGVLVVWASLGYRFIRYPDPMDRVLAVCVGVGVTVLAVLILRGPVLPNRWDADGTGSSPDSADTHSHHGDDGGHGGSDGGDGGGH